MSLVQRIRRHWRPAVVVLVPILLSVLALPTSKRSSESRCAFLAVVVAIFWITEVLPLPVTSLLPLTLCPLLEVQSNKDTYKPFFGEVTALVIGSLCLAIAIEKTMLHKRIALVLIKKIGMQQRRLIFSVIFTTAFLSMWIGNTAAAAVMTPLVRALLATSRHIGDERESESGIEYQKESLAESGTEPENGSWRLLQTGGGDGFDNMEQIGLNEDGVAETKGEGDLDHGSLCRASTAAKNPDIEIDVGTNTDETKIHNAQLRNTLSFDEETAHLRRFNKSDGRQIYWNSSKYDFEKTAASPENVPQEETTSTLRVFSLCIAYSANIGGMATLIGSPPNLVLFQVVNMLSGRSVINFSNWLLFGIPVSVICLFLTYIWLNLFLQGDKQFRNKDQISSARSVVQQQLEEIGPIKFNEKVVIAHLVALVLLWLTRCPGFIPGWSIFFSEGYVTDGLVAVAVAVCLFIAPGERPSVLCLRNDNIPYVPPSVLSWKLVNKRLPWGLLFLLGGGMVLANAMKVSGLSNMIISHLLVVRHMPQWLICLVVTCFACAASELMNNTVVAILILPLLGNMAAALQVHPLYLMFPATLASSMTFMLPLASPANAFVYRLSEMRISDMVKYGSLINLIGVGVILLATHTWAWTAFDLGRVPQWGSLTLNSTSGNDTSSANASWPLETTHLFTFGNHSNANLTTVSL